MDAQQSDAVARAGGIRGRESVWPRRVDEPAGRGADGDFDRTGCVGRAPGADAEDGHASGRADRHSGGPRRREHVLHVLCGGGDGVSVVADAVFCARCGDRFSAWPGDEDGALGMGCERNAANVVGSRAGGVAMEPRRVCGAEVRVLLLPGIGVGVDARAGAAGGAADGGRARGDSRGRACAGVAVPERLCWLWAWRIKLMRIFIN